MLYLGDCLDVMADLPDASVDCICADVPYGTTACAWDSVIPFEPMWAHLKRLIKPRGAIVLFGQEPFSSLLRVSNLDWYKYDWVWKKSRSMDFFNNKNKPREIHELLSVFSEGTTANRSPNRMLYNPQGLVRIDKPWHRPQHSISDHRTARPSHALNRIIEYGGYPETVIEFANPNQGLDHPTQKPVALMAYLVKTYTDPGDVVLDFAMGSGSTGVAAIETGRQFIGIEKDQSYYDVAVQRMAEAAYKVSPAAVPLLTQAGLEL